MSTLCTDVPSFHPLRESLYSGCDNPTIVYSLAAGRDRIVSGDDLCNDSHAGTINEWAIPDPRAIVEEPMAYQIRVLVDTGDSHILPETMQVCRRPPPQKEPTPVKRGSVQAEMRSFRLCLEPDL